MWNRGGRSTALERAQALLSGRRNGISAAESRDLIEHYEDRYSAAEITKKAVSGDGPSEKRAAAPPTGRTPFLDLSDLSSSASSGIQHGHSTTGSAAAAVATAGERQGREGDQLPQSSGGGGSRFLKKAAPSAASSQSPAFSKSQRQQPPQPSYVLSTQRSSQSAALSRLAAIEDRVRSRKQAQTPAQGQTRDGQMPAQTLLSNLGISPPPPPPPQPQCTSTPLSARSSSDLGLMGNRFLKRTTASAAADSATSTSAVPPKDPEVRLQTPAAAGDDAASSLVSTRRAAASTPLARLGAEPIRATGGGVSLDSDEEDMRRLLGVSPDWTENSLRQVGRTSSLKTTVKPLGKSSQKTSPTPPPTVVRSSSVRHPPRSPPSSPRRFSGSRTGTHRSPSPPVPSASAILSPSPSPSDASLSSSRARVPPRSLSSSISGHNEAVRSLEELFPVAPGGSEEEDPSERSEISSDDFQMNVMTLDDLAPVPLGLTEGTAGKQQKDFKPSKTPPLRILTSDQQLPGQEEEEEVREEEAPNYESDFESESRSEPELDASEISERLRGDGEEGKGVSEASEVRDELESESDRSRGQTRADKCTSASFSEDRSRSYDTRTPDRSRTSDKSLSRSRDSSYSRCSNSDSDWSSSNTVTPSCPSRRRSSRRRAVREAAVQTQPDALGFTWSTGMATLGPSVGMTYVDPTPIASHTVSAEAVEALSAYSPAVFALNDMLRQQLALTRHFIHTNRHLYSSLLHSLGPADYTYTTLEDTKEFIRIHKPPKLTVEEALEEVLQEMRDYHYI